MTASRLPRRAVLGAVLSASLMGAGIAAIAAEPTTAPCTTFTDPAGDSGPADAPGVPAPEDDLDITGVAFDTVDGKLVLTTYVKKLNIAPEYSFGDRFAVTFTHGKKAIEAYTFRYNPEDAGTVLGEAFFQKGVRVDGSTKIENVDVVYDTKASKVVLSFALKDLDTASGVPTAGASFTALAAEASGDNVAFYEPWDTAAAPKDKTYAVGSRCGGAAAPAAPAAPAPAPSPSPSPSPAPAPSATPTATVSAGLPAADCFLAKDAKGDSSIRAVTTAPGTPNDPDLDLLGLTVGTTADSLVAYAKVDKLAAGPAQSTDGHRFTFYFTHNKHVFAMAGSAYKTAAHGDIRNGAASTGQFSAVTQLTVDGPPLTDPNSRVAPGFVPSGLKFVFDQKNSYVIATLPLKDIDKYGKAPAAGATFTNVYAISAADTDLVSNQADVVPDGASASAPAKTTYAVGDNRCFAPPVPPLSSVGAVKAQYGDAAVVAAKLVDAAGKPVAGKKVTFSLGTAKAVGTTAANGIARATLPVKEKAGKRSLVLTSDATKVTTPFTVLVEKTALKASGGGGSVTATLTDDDRKPVAGQLVTFTSGAKKVTARTAANGVAKATGFASGSAVKVSYAGATGMYSAASASTSA